MGVYEVERPLAVGAVIEEADGLCLDGYAPLSLQFHGVQDLGYALPLGDGVGCIQQPVREGALAMINMRDYAEIADAFDASHP
jgi:hypothetical protein